jgi:hypothetical protein
LHPSGRPHTDIPRFVRIGALQCRVLARQRREAMAALSEG